MNVQHNEDFSRVANSVKIEVYETGFADLDSEWRQKDVCSPFSRLYYVISGKGYLRIHSGNDDQEEIQELIPGHVYLIPNGYSYDYFCDDRLEKVYIHINVLLQNGLELFSGCKQYYELPVEEAYLKKMKQWMMGRSPEDFFRMQGEVYHAVAAFINEADVAEKVNRQYSEMVTRLFAILPGMKLSVSIQEIARMLNASESTLAKHFKKETGMSIGRYRELLIMDRARQLLAIGGLTIGDISEELGFADQFYFCKYFKQRQGMTPSQYRVNYKI